jgi:hypothetical protein
VTNAVGLGNADAYRGDAIARFNAAWKSAREGGEWQYDLLRGMADLLLAIDTRLANQPPPVYVITSSGDPDLDRETVERFQSLIRDSGRGAV